MRAESNQFPYNYICIEGNIGTGKTTFCKMLAQDFPSELILEQFTDNPFLPKFYKDPQRYAFPVELFFMSERYKQLQTHLINKGIFNELYIADYFFRKTALFAQKNLNEEEYRLFLRFFEILNQLFPDPDILVYLHRSVDKLYEHIQVRNRKIERDLQKQYLLEIQHSYFEFFRSETRFPIIIVDIEELDFEESYLHYQKLKEVICKEYKPGVHRITIS